MAEPGTTLFKGFTKKDFVNSIRNETPEEAPKDLSEMVRDLRSDETRIMVATLLRVQELKQQIQIFSPSLIVGVSRGGAIMAAALSTILEQKGKPKIPIVTLWPDKNGNQPVFSNKFNPFDFTELDVNKDLFTILIVDDYVLSGNHLVEAKKFVQKIIPWLQNSNIKTAAISYIDVVPEECRPNFYLSETKFNPEYANSKQRAFSGKWSP